jgi:hypothetical protein
MWRKPMANGGPYSYCTYQALIHAANDAITMIDTLKAELEQRRKEYDAMKDELDAYKKIVKIIRQEEEQGG